MYVACNRRHAFSLFIRHRNFIFILVYINDPHLSDDRYQSHFNQNLALVIVANGLRGKEKEREKERKMSGVLTSDACCGKRKRKGKGKEKRRLRTRLICSGAAMYIIRNVG